MAKRNYTLQNHASKKPKIDDFNDFWDDDLDGDLIDDCFKRATQQETSSQTNDVTLLSSYSIFKDRNIVTSTQVSPGFQAGGNGDSKLKELQEKYAEKEGEVCILRTNLQKLRASCQIEQEKKDIEWKDKLNMSQKENKTIRSELEFKNLEVANLKQQIAELSRHVNTEQNATQKRPVDSKGVKSPQKPVDKTIISSTKIHINSEKYYPLKRFDFSFIFDAELEEKNMVKNKYNLYKTTISYLQSQSGQEDADFLTNLMKRTILIGEKKLNVDYVYPELAYLISLSEDEIDSEASIPPVNKVIYVSLQLLTDFYNYLKRIEENLQLQDVQQSDSLYLQESGKSKCKNSSDVGYNNLNEVGVKSGKLLGFLAEIVPFNTYFRNHLLKDHPLSLNGNEDYVTLLPIANMKTKEKYHYLELILKLVSTIGKTRKEQFCTVFLSAVIKLLCRIFSSNELNDSKKLVYETTMEILFLRPRLNIIFQITSLLKVASRDSSFIDVICCKVDEVKIVENATKGVLHFSKESCRFNMFAALLQNTLSKIEEENLLVQISSNLLSFIYNIFKSNVPWLYQQESKRCKCLCQLYKLGIGIIYKNLKMYQELGSMPSVSSHIFKNSIKILNLLAFNSYDLTQKYVTEFAQFKEIIYTLTHLPSNMNLDEDELKNLENLNTTEDLPEISNERFIAMEL